VPKAPPIAPEPAVRRWLEEVVIGLGLCPFAAPPWRRDAVRLMVSDADDAVDLLAELQSELLQLDAADPRELETTLVIVPRLFAAFEDFNQFLDPVDGLLERFDWVGKFQIASFHPDYRFADAADDDAGNLTNRSPYPILHLIREESLSLAIAQFPDTDDIPRRNIARMQALTETERMRLFPYLFAAPIA
jgi:hypothetical protein